MRPTAAILPLSILLLVGCSGVSVDSDFDPSADFSSLTTYRWLSTKASGDPALDSGLLQERIRRSVDAAMSAKGYRRSDGGSTDFCVASHVSKQSKVDVETIPAGFGYVGWGGGLGTETEVDQYEEGTLMIDVIDGAGKKLLWRGTGKTRIASVGSPAARDKEVAEVVNAILAKFPPGAK